MDTNDLAASAVTGAKILDGTVSLADLNTDAVNSAKILDSSVALADLAGDSVNSSKIVDASVALADLASNSVDGTKVSNGTLKLGDLSPQTGTVSIDPPSLVSINTTSCAIVSTALTGVAVGDQVILHGPAGVLDPRIQITPVVQDTVDVLKVKACNISGTNNLNLTAQTWTYTLLRP